MSRSEKLGKIENKKEESTKKGESYFFKKTKFNKFSYKENCKKYKHEIFNKKPKKDKKLKILRYQKCTKTITSESEKKHKKLCEYKMCQFCKKLFPDEITNLHFQNCEKKKLINKNVKKTVNKNKIKKNKENPFFKKINFIFKNVEKKFFKINLKKKKKNGLRKDVLKKLKLVYFKKDYLFKEEKCVICFSHFEKEDILKVLPCKDVFHRECIDSWFMKNCVCIFCKKSVE